MGFSYTVLQYAVNVINVKLTTLQHEGEYRLDKRCFVMI